MNRTTYFLRLRSARVIGLIALDVETLASAKSLALEWAKEMGESVTKTWVGSPLPRGKFKIEITDERGETQWTL